ncbi:MAG: gamma-glutamylcyclotransferase [Candidatus Omnitrophica bacterium]|nr:gamma-glutamylcyclotransferase [Candidatus Omnitrophota bacterium]
MLYFAYGSNMNEDELTDIGVTILKAERVLLRGYKIALTRFSNKRCGGVLDILSSEKDTVEGVLYEIPDKDKLKIDIKEGLKGGAYRQIPKPLQVETMAGAIRKGVISYEVCEKEKPLYPPAASTEYKNSVLRGACEHGLLEDYRKKLKVVLEKRKTQEAY